jgi:hypothetical protein
MTEAKKTFAFPLFDALSAIDAKDRTFYDTMPDDAKKAFSPFVIMKWLSASQGSRGLAEYYLEATNAIVNKGLLFDLKDDPKLQYLLLTVVGSGRSVRHDWVGMSKKTKAKNQLDDFIRRLHPGANQDEISIVRSQLTREHVNELAYDLGCQEPEVVELLARWDEDNGQSVKKPKSKPRKRKETV